MRALYFCIFTSLLICLLPISIVSQESTVQGTMQQEFQQWRPEPQTSESGDDEDDDDSIRDQIKRLQLAISNENYPVTPGDIFRISFTTAGSPVSNQIIVESDYTLNLGVFGEIDAQGMKLPELKKKVEKLVQEAYPRSLPSLTMISTGTFQIPVVGEIPKTKYVQAWGLSRLSEVVSEDVIGRHSSLRNVEIIAKNGRSQKYDLWMARYKGDLSQNPYVKPGDRVIVSRVKKQIQVTGEVYRPGKYQLLEDESLQDLRFFTGGFTPLADLKRITVERFTGAEAELIVKDFSEYELEGFEFKDRDIVTVPSKRDEDLRVTVVGAVMNPGSYRFTPPEKYMYYVNRAGGIDFERNSNNEVAIIDRYGNKRNIDMPVMPGDTIHVLNNDFIYNHNRYFPVVTTGFAFILTIIQIINLAN